MPACGIDWALVRFLRLRNEWKRPDYDGHLSGLNHCLVLAWRRFCAQSILLMVLPPSSEPESNFQHAPLLYYPNLCSWWLGQVGSSAAFHSRFTTIALKWSQHIHDCKDPNAGEQLLLTIQSPYTPVSKWLVCINSGLHFGELWIYFFALSQFFPPHIINLLCPSWG